MVLEFQQLRIAMDISSPMHFQYCWEKRGGNPSRPRAFNGSICFKALSTSSLVYSAVSNLFMSTSIETGMSSTTASTMDGLEVVKSCW